jgi:amino acid adenylation domain-containing protein
MWIGVVMPSIQHRFADQVRRAPDAVAVSCGQVRLTYRELDQRANQLAHRLLDLGVRPEDPVAVLMERSADLVVAILAVVKAGGCFLPLHETYPLRRMQWILDQVGEPVLLTDRATMKGRDLPHGGPMVVVDAEEPRPAPPPPSVHDPGVDSTADQLAYIIYTSGSSGEPKGVAVTHRGVLEVALDSCWDTGWHERVLMVAPYAFSVSTYELWVPLLRGGCLVVAPPGVPTVESLRQLIAGGRITGLHLTAGLFRVLADEDPRCLAGVREVLTGGDVIAASAVRRVLQACPGLTVRATYGQTEATLFTMSMPMRDPESAAGGIPLGRPLDGVRHYVLDERLRPVPSGRVGELYLAGDRLARGYVQRADLTAQSFVADPFSAGGERMYRTGDLVRESPDGLLEFVGRDNDQVKIRGFRVEPREIEEVLAAHPGVADVAVIARESSSGDKQVVAYVVPGPTGVDVDGLRRLTAESLPGYMVPAAFVVLTGLPLTPNGKLDRRALPEPTLRDVDQQPPDGVRQKLLCAILADVFGVAQVGVHDSFFDLGGQSLQAMRIVNQIRQAFGVDLGIGDIFEAPTVAELDRKLDSREPVAQPARTER